nr:Transcriptional regulator, PadR family [Kibdelosporangium sp. MJ126-NF4]CTQ97949.1 Transcriptional regulator, PadR family [Kibdelosporangium sp. MJ126-NF4]
MSEQAFLVLTALAEHPLHGYAIVQAVETMSEGRVRLRVGTLYGVLDRLVADGLAERDREEIHQGRLRRYYRLTDSGIQALAAEVNRLSANIRAASSVLKAAGFAPPRLEGGLA